MSRFGKAFTALSGYFFSSVLTAAAAFFAIPLLTRLLGLEEFGRWLLLEPLQLILSQVALLGTNYGIVKQITYDGYGARALFLKIALAVQPVMLAIMVVCILVLPRLDFSLREAGLFALLVELEALYILLQAAFRASSCVTGFVAGTVIKTGFLIVLGVTFLESAGMTVESVLLWRVVTTGAGVLLGVLILCRQVLTPAGDFGPPPKPSPFHVYANGVRYGAPILATGLLAMVIEYADRYILKANFDYRLLAAYLIYMKVAACLTPAITTPFNLWWATERFKRLADDDGGKAFFANTALLVLVLYLVAGGILWIVSPTVVAFFAPDVPYRGDVIIVLIMSVIAMSMAGPLNIGLLNEGKTHLNIIAASVGALLHVSLCVALIRPFGAMGGAIATLLSYGAYSGFLNYLSQRVYPVPFPYSAMLKVVIVAALGLCATAVVDVENEYLAAAAKGGVFAMVLLLFMRRQLKTVVASVLNRQPASSAGAV